MEDRYDYILEAAKQLFLRYGVKRTGMNDIAREAGISRQTLYKAFANKDEVLRATIRSLADRVVLDIEAGLKKAGGLGAQLDVVFKHAVIEHYDFLQSSPNAEDIIAGVTSTSQKELEAGAKRNTEIIARVLKPYSSAIENCDLTVDQYADFIQRSSTAAKYNAKSKKHLIDMLSALRMSALKVTSSV
ncbi:helix-turn-helix domain-containing protein [Ruegeria sp. 2205SS24-7]|uniref:TetR/AcrR family transcriptional regulator n=1 Tax=Ruegeria discodermiae TaxID=3064389 RepID=UPI0027416664|nr:TetR/AcrR family transcriptional regulator [Ruegeria sp. 2205SS24-7]MDP5220800.1 helix-turn-helix domain-containing protein [Ruegeria sp. 2205SS24-7]